MKNQKNINFLLPSTLCYCMANVAKNRIVHRYIRKSFQIIQDLEVESGCVFRCKWVVSFNINNIF